MAELLFKLKNRALLIFDPDGDLRTSVSEFFDPVVLAVEQTDANDDGEFSNEEISELMLSYEKSEENLRTFRNKYIH